MNSEEKTKTQKLAFANFSDTGLAARLAKKSGNR
jgi:hypothetical protein